ncbi:MAG TPA: ribosome maturation factor RimM [Chloroflexota bacterium]
MPSSKPPQPAKAPASTSTSSEASSDDLLVVAQVLAPHGIRGELKCRIVTDFPKQRFKRGNAVLLDGQRHTIQAGRVQGQTVLLKLEDIPDRTAAEAFRGKDVLIRAEDAVSLPKGQFFWHQVIGLTVVDVTKHQELGRVHDILETGANDVYVVKTEHGREILIPAIKDVVKDIDPGLGRILVEPLPGMLPP